MNTPMPPDPMGDFTSFVAFGTAMVVAGLVIVGLSGGQAGGGSPTAKLAQPMPPAVIPTAPSSLRNRPPSPTSI